MDGTIEGNASNTPQNAAFNSRASTSSMDDNSKSSDGGRRPSDISQDVLRNGNLEGKKLIEYK